MGLLTGLSSLLPKLLLSLVTGKYSPDAIKLTPVDGELHLKGVAHGVKAFGYVWEFDVTARRTR